MEEDTIELIDYLRVIWKRKRLIIVGTLVCMLIAGVVVSLMLPKIYRAEALVSIGKRVVASPSPSLSLVPLDTLENLSESIPVEYGLENEGESLKYPLKVKVVKGSTLIKLTLEGPDRMKVEELLEGVVDKLINDHLNRFEVSLQPFEALIGKMEVDIEKIQGEIIPVEKKLEKVNPEKDDMTLVITAQNYLLQKKDGLRKIQQELLFYKFITKSLDWYKTKVIGGVTAKKDPIKPRKKLSVLMAGFIGLIIFLLLAFIMEYVEKMKEREQDVSV